MMPSASGLVSVVVPAYNVEDYLPKCLSCLSAQTYRNLEILLIDDGSTDGTAAICDEYAARDSRVRVFHQENQGICAVRTRGIAESRGEFLIFPDGDDYFHKDYLRLLVEAINLGGRAYPLAICGFEKTDDPDLDIVSDIEPTFQVLSQAELMENTTAFPGCESALWGANWNKLYRKSALPTPFQKNYPRSQDYDSCLRMAYVADSAVLVPQCLYVWYQRPASLTNSEGHIALLDECRARIFFDHLSEIPERVAGRDFRHNLMVALYNRLIIWKRNSRGTKEWKSAARKIARIERATRWRFLTCPHEKLSRKIGLLLRLHRV